MSWLVVAALAVASLVALAALAVEVANYRERARRQRDEEYRRLIEHGDADVRNLR